jgi:hypothetical protein
MLDEAPAEGCVVAVPIYQPLESRYSVRAPPLELGRVVAIPVIRPEEPRVTDGTMPITPLMALHAEHSISDPRKHNLTWQCFVKYRQSLSSELTPFLSLEATNTDVKTQPHFLGFCIHQE